MAKKHKKASLLRKVWKWLVLTFWGRFMSIVTLALAAIGVWPIIQGWGTSPEEKFVEEKFFRGELAAPNVNIVPYIDSSIVPTRAVIENVEMPVVSLGSGNDYVNFPIKGLYIKNFMRGNGIIIMIGNKFYSISTSYFSGFLNRRGVDILKWAMPNCGENSLVLTIRDDRLYVSTKIN